MTIRWNETRSRELADPPLWELFHENSKRGRHEPGHPARATPGDVLQARYLQFPCWTLPRDLIEPNRPLSDLLQGPWQSNELAPIPLSQEVLATILYCAAGVPAQKRFLSALGAAEGAGSPEGLEAVELIFFSREVEALPTGLYAYDADAHELRQLVAGDLTARIASALVPQRFAVSASILVFVAGRFAPLLDRHGDRGYRLTLIQSGQILRIMELVSSALGLGCIAITEFRDRDIDRLVGLDGLMSSVLVVVAIGARTVSQERE